MRCFGGRREEVGAGAQSRGTLFVGFAREQRVASIRRKFFSHFTQTRIVPRQCLGKLQRKRCIVVARAQLINNLAKQIISREPTSSRVSAEYELCRLEG